MLAERIPGEAAKAAADPGGSGRSGRSVMHLVDTLEAGGAETMAVLLANALAEAGWDVHLCATRRGGALEGRVGAGVRLVLLRRRGRFDLAALVRLVRYVRRERIRLLHAHGTAVFVAAAVRMMGGGVRVVWHDHYGRQEESERPVWLYAQLRRWVDAVVAVNGRLAEWAVERLRFGPNRVWVVPNFACLQGDGRVDGLPGLAESRIVQVANVRPQKDHAMMLRAMARIVEEEPRAHLLLVGECGEDGHGGQVRRMIRELGLEGRVSVLGARRDVGAILRSCAVGVLSSASEGLPVALLEYGEAALGVVCTDVGDCRRVVEGCGRLVRAGDDAGMARAVLELLRKPEERERLGRLLRERVRENWSREAALRQWKEVYAAILG